MRIASGSPSSGSSPPSGAVDAEDRARQFGAAGADQAGQAEDLAAAQREVDRAGRDRSLVRRPRRLERRLPGGAAGGV